jgi:acetyl-CoA carboxylase biotin carboxylase subunit
MNTRLQVEHPITEAVTGVDFVRAQIEIARGAKLADLKVGISTMAIGHAIEVRVYAENPDEGFLPSPGRITHLRAPAGPGIRDDSGAFAGWTVPMAYDPLVSKVVAWALDRPGAIARMVRALTEYDVRGISTTIGFCRDLVASPAFAAAEFDTTYVDRVLEQDGRKGARSDEAEEIAAIAAAMWWSVSQAGLKASTTTETVVAQETSAAPETDAAPEVGAAPETVANDAGAKTDVVPTFRSAKPADSLWARRGRLDSLR